LKLGPDRCPSIAPALADDGRTLTVTFTADPTGLNIIIPNNTLLDINGNAYAGATLLIEN